MCRSLKEAELLLSSFKGKSNMYFSTNNFQLKTLQFGILFSTQISKSKTNIVLMLCSVKVFRKQNKKNIPF